MTTTARPATWVKNGLPFLLLRVSGQAAEVGAFVVLARELAPAQFGRLSVAFLVARYLGLVADWGASIRGVRDVARGDASVDALLRRRIVVACGLTSVYAVAAALWVSPALAALGAVVAARGLNRDWLSLGRERGLASGASSVAQGVVLLVVSAFAHSLGTAASAVALGYACGLAVSLVVNPRPKVARGDSRPAGVDGWMLGSVLADQVTISADTFLLAAMRGAGSAGVYAAVYRIPNAWMTVTGLVMLGMVAPVVRQMHTASRAETLALRRRSLKMGAAAGAAVVASALPAYYLVPVVFGDAYRGGRNALLVLMLGTAVMTVGASLHPLYFALARDRDVFTLALSGTATNVAVNLIAIPMWGMGGAALATLVAQLLLFVLLLARLQRLVDHAAG